MRSQKTSFIVTIFNEEKTIDAFLESLFQQVKKPDEIIIVDGGSKDQTVSKIKKYQLIAKSKRIMFKFLVKPGNRSIGRNEAIKHATGEIILCSDSGNKLDKNWIKNILKPFDDRKVDVVAGYYQGKAKTVFQKAVIPYALVMADKVNSDDFLPATRSVAFTKVIWKKVHGFDEKYSHNEDYVFARKLRDSGAKIVFAMDAIVYWFPRNNLRQFFIMLWRFAFGDAEAGILRSTVVLLFSRYLIGLYLLLLCVLFKSVVGLIVLGILLLCYILWSINKNYKYVKNFKAFYLLPILQFTADAAVLSGTVLGIMKRLKTIDVFSLVKKNKMLVAVLLVYSSLLITTIQWGIPNENRAYPFHMDEWHQLQAVGNTFRYGTPNTEGSANGTMFHFLYTGLYLIPFTAVQYVDPFSLEITNSVMRERIFIVLRLQTLLFGILSIIVLYKLAGLIGASRNVSILLFTFTPIWLAFSGYFKYDIALMFWMLLSFLFMFKYYKQPTNQNYLLAGIPVGLSFAVKVSAIPLFLLFVISFFLFNPKWKQNVKFLFLGLLVVLLCAVLFGIPDTLFGKGNIIHFFYENVISGPTATNYFNLQKNPYLYLIADHYPRIFGYGLFFALILAIFFWIVTFIKTGLKKSFEKYKVVFFILISFFVFLLSLVPLQIFAGGNRSLVLLPFLVLLPALAINALRKYALTHAVVSLLLLFVVALQVYISVSWMYVKFAKSPQVASSEWILKNVKKGQIFGVENIPIYQSLPDVIQKEYYLLQYDANSKTNFSYEVIDSSTKKLPAYVVVTSGETEAALLNNSPKRKLLIRLKNEKYKKVATFQPDLKYLNVSDKDYALSWLITAPITISVYTR